MDNGARSARESAFLAVPYSEPLSVQRKRDYREHQKASRPDWGDGLLPKAMRAGLCFGVDLRFAPRAGLMHGSPREPSTLRAGAGSIENHARRLYLFHLVLP
jgi:hypothetical protein